eukprot:TRINITY_DN5217_c0_g1_i1.p1 TRINITY_DN5217_c0_g1~~TRINITY_DN5217_c0_g1_i1.p1  ORF type:complete len:1497 (+),score=312.24 TRINITY_DN5217_c0_g1_i1:47-4537(+)
MSTLSKDSMLRRGSHTTPNLSVDVAHFSSQANSNSNTNTPSATTPSFSSTTQNRSIASANFKSSKSSLGTNPVNATFPLLIHQKTFSSEILLVNPEMYPALKVNDIVELEAAQTSQQTIANQTQSAVPMQNASTTSVLIQISSLAPIKGNVRVSLLKQIADMHGFQQRQDVVLKPVLDLKPHSVDYLEVTFKDQLIGRDDMYRLQKCIIGKCIHLHQTLSFAGVRAQVKEILIQGRPVLCGLVTDSTKFTFRSRSTTYCIFIQLSKEMWEFNEYGLLYFEKVVSHFLRNLFEKWTTAGVTHKISLIFFSRTHYDFTLPSLQSTDGDESTAKLRSMGLDPKSIRVDASGRPYQDFYKFILETVFPCDWESILFLLKREFGNYPTAANFVSPSGTKKTVGKNSTAAEGNLLEAMNLALSDVEQACNSRDLTRTNHIILIATAGTFFEVDRELTRITKQRIIDSGIGVDLVSMSSAPMHIAPMFIYHKTPKQIADDSVKKSSLGESIGSRGSPERVKETKDEQSNHHIPHWISMGFYHPEEVMDALSISSDYMDSGRICRTNLKLPYFIFRNVDRDLVITPSVPSSALSLPQFTDPENIDFDNYDTKVFHSASNTESSRPPPRHALYSQPQPLEVAIKETAKKTLEDMSYRDKRKTMDISNMRVKFTPGDPELSVGRDERSPIDFHLRGSRHGSFDASPSEKDPNVHNEPVARAIKMNARPRKGSLSKSKESQEVGDYFRRVSTSISMKSANDERSTPRLSSKSMSRSKHEINPTSFLNWDGAEFKTSNPYNPVKSTHRVSSNRRRWGHLFPGVILLAPAAPLLDAMPVSWKSLVEPAALPLTTDYFPSPSELSTYTSYVYNISLADAPENPTKYREKMEALFPELVLQRLAHDFQIVVQPENRSHHAGGKQSVCMSLSDSYHVLTLDPTNQNIDIKKYLRSKYPDDRINYAYTLLYPHESRPVIRQAVFQKRGLNDYNWNHLDHLVFGHLYVMMRELYYNRVRLCLQTALVQENSRGNDRKGKRMSEDPHAEIIKSFQKFKDSLLVRGSSGTGNDDDSHMDVVIERIYPGSQETVDGQQTSPGRSKPRRDHFIKFAVDTKSHERTEWLLMQYDPVFYADCNYHIELQWMVCSGASAYEFFQLICRRAKQFGFNIIQVPSDDPFEHPSSFHNPVEIPMRLSMPPQDVESVKLNVLAKSGFQRDSDRNFLHDSGDALVRMSPSGFLWVYNQYQSENLWKKYSTKPDDAALLESFTRICEETAIEYAGTSFSYYDLIEGELQVYDSDASDKNADRYENRAESDENENDSNEDEEDDEDEPRSSDNDNDEDEEDEDDAAATARSYRYRRRRAALKAFDNDSDEEEKEEEEDDEDDDDEEDIVDSDQDEESDQDDESDFDVDLPEVPGLEDMTIDDNHAKGRMLSDKVERKSRNSRRNRLGRRPSPPNMTLTNANQSVPSAQFSSSQVSPSTSIDSSASDLLLGDRRRSFSFHLKSTGHDSSM